MRKRKEVSKERLEELYLKSGYTLTRIQKELGISRKVLYDYLRDYKIEKSSSQKWVDRSKWLKKYNDQELALQVKDLYIDKNLRIKEVKEALNISAGKLFKILHSLNYKRPAEISQHNMLIGNQERKGKKKRYIHRKYSMDENRAYELLLNKFSREDINRQYQSPLYPYPCDFYIKSLDLYIEFNPGPRHHGRPFNPASEKDLNELKEIKALANKSDWYEGIIRTWTIRDPEKRQVAKDNQLNWKEFWSLGELEAWLTQGL